MTLSAYVTVQPATRHSSPAPDLHPQWSAVPPIAITVYCLIVPSEQQTIEVFWPRSWSNHLLLPVARDQGQLDCGTLNIVGDKR